MDQDRLPHASSLATVDRDPDCPDCPDCGGAGGYWVRRDGEERYARCRCAVRMQRRRALTSSWSYLGLGQRGLADLDVLPAQSAAAQAVRGYAERPEGWLVLLGGTGTGKTALIGALAWDITDRLDLIFIKASRLVMALRGAITGGNVEYELAKQVQTPCLMLDDLGAESRTEFASECLYEILDLRYQARMPTVITSNLPLAQLGQRVASRALDRLLSQVVVLRGDDRRVYGEADSAPRAGTASPLHMLGTDEVVCRFCDSRPCTGGCPKGGAGGAR